MLNGLALAYLVTRLKKSGPFLPLNINPCWNIFYQLFFSLNISSPVSVSLILVTVGKKKMEFTVFDVFCYKQQEAKKNPTDQMTSENVGIWGGCRWNIDNSKEQNSHFLM